MNAMAELTRRAFLADLGRGSLAIALVGIAGCMPSAAGSVGPSQSAAAGSGSSPLPSLSGGGSSPLAGAASSGSASGAPSSSGGVAWTRVNLGFVSAYILVRGGEAAVVDTGVAGSADEIEAALTGIGLHWAAVAHVILTHKHPDHAGSLTDVLTAAAAATGYAGAADLPSITSPRALTTVADGDDVFGLRIVATPGHTRGHVSVLDEAGGVLVAGDALGTTTGTLAGSKSLVHGGRVRGGGHDRQARDVALRDAPRRPRRTDPDRRIGASRCARRRWLRWTTSRS